jgi:iron complex outermembrane receptor protein
MRGIFKQGTRWVVLAVFFLGPPGAFAEDTVEKRQILEKMQVTSTRTRKAKDLAPASTSVITREDMEISQVRTIDEALRYEPGLNLDRSAGLGDALPGITMRGLPGDERTLVMVDGIPVNDAYSSLVPFNNINPDAIRQIEVVRGPGSALYGGDAMGSAMNLITGDPKKLTIGAKTGMGSYGRRTAGGTIGDRLGGRFSVLANFDWEAQDGYATSLVAKTSAKGAGTVTGGYSMPYDMDPATGQVQNRHVIGDKGDKSSERFGGSLRASADTSETGKATLSFFGGSHSYYYDAPRSYLLDAAGNPVFTGSVTTSAGHRTLTAYSTDFLAGKGAREYYAPALTYKETFGPVDFTAKLAWQHRIGMYTQHKTTPNTGTYYTAKGQVVDSESDAYIAEAQADYHWTWGREHVLTTGLCYKDNTFDQETTETAHYLTEDSTYGSVIDMTRGKTRFFAPFVQNEWSLHDQVTLYTGARMDWWRAGDGEAGAPNKPWVFEDKGKSQLSPKISAVWEPVKKATYIKASVAQAFRPPAIYDLFRTWVSGTTLYRGNPDLEPETLWNYELGVDQYLFSRKIRLGITGYYSQVKDLIGSLDGTPFAPYTRVSEKKNISDVDILGLETEARLYPADWLQMFVNYSHCDTEIKKNDADPALEGNRLTGSPTFPMDVVNLGADLEFWKFRYGITGKYTGKTHWRTDNLYTGDETYMGYTEHWRFDTKLSFKATENVTASFAVNDLFDEEKYIGGSIAEGRTVYGEIRFDI